MNGGAKQTHNEKYHSCIHPREPLYSQIINYFHSCATGHAKTTFQLSHFVSLRAHSTHRIALSISLSVSVCVCVCDVRFSIFIIIICCCRRSCFFFSRFCCSLQARSLSFLFASFIYIFLAFFLSLAASILAFHVFYVL